MRGGSNTWRFAVAIAWLLAAALAVVATEAANGVNLVLRAQEPKAGTVRTVWDGVYSEAQAARGQALYMTACASCHAKDLRGESTAPSLVEDTFSFQWNDTSVGELLVRIRTLMPYDRPDSLPGQTYRDIVAFILQSNKFPPGPQELDADADTLKQIRIVAKRPESKP